jgi:Gram-negative bacterial TonB protein C-terminal
MKKTIFSAVFFLALSPLAAQVTLEFMLNSFFQKTYIPSAKRYMRKVQAVDTLWQYSDYSNAGKLVQTGFYTDTNFTTPASHTVFYQDGRKLYEGDYINGKPAGYWYFFDAAGNISDSLFYYWRDATKKLTDTQALAKAAALKNEHLKRDSSAPAIQMEKPPAFPGGSTAWRNHLLKYLHIPDLVMETSPYSKGTIQVQFVVCNDGEVCSIQALNSVHPLVDLIAVKAIQKGPRWEPAVQNGRNVKALQRQPVTFVFE